MEEVDEKEYPDCSVWNDIFSYEEDEKSDYYMLWKGKWNFIGRHKNYIEALERSILILDKIR